MPITCNFPDGLHGPIMNDNQNSLAARGRRHHKARVCATRRHQITVATRSQHIATNRDGCATGEYGCCQESRQGLMGRNHPTFSICSSLLAETDC